MADAAGQVAELPLGLRWEVVPASWSVDGDLIVVQAAGSTDIFVDPAGSPPALNGARALADAPQGRWQFTAHVSADLRETYDAASLLLWSDDRHFAKLCLERSPQGSATVVSVVTREVSDDANAWPVGTNDVWLRISNVGKGAYTFHSSADGVWWDLVRYFALVGDTPMRFGIEAQSPLGARCTTTFDMLTLSDTHLADIRDGS